MPAPTKPTAEDILKEFETFIHKGEDGDDPEDQWAWTIRGSFPAEVKTWLQTKLTALDTTARQEGAEADRQRIVEMVEGMKKEVSPEDEYAADYGTGKLYGWNNALDDVIEKIKEIK